MVSPYTHWAFLSIYIHINTIVFHVLRNKIGNTEEKSVHSKMENEPEKHVMAIQRVKHNRFIGNEIHSAQHRENEQKKKSNTFTQRTRHMGQKIREKMTINTRSFENNGCLDHTVKNILYFFMIFEVGFFFSSNANENG